MVTRNPMPGAAPLRVQAIHPDDLPALVIRAPQGATSTGASTLPNIAEPSEGTSAPSSNNGTGELAKSVLEYLFLSAALIVLASVILRRVFHLRRANQPFTAFFHFAEDDSPFPSYGGSRGFPRTTGIPNVPFAGPYPDPHLTGFPPVYLGQPGRRIRATDTDWGGRRLGDRVSELDHGGMLGDKDILPAYDSFGGPPGYADLELQSRLFPQRNTTDRSIEPSATQPPGNTNLPADSMGAGRPDASQETTSSSPPHPPPSPGDMVMDNS